MVNSLGSISQPWEMTAILIPVDSMYPEAMVTGETVRAVNGWFNFTELAISHPGDYQVQFMVTQPEGASALR